MSSPTAVADGGNDSLLGLIPSAIPPRLRTAVNAWIVGRMVVSSSRRAYTSWRNRVEYTVTIRGDHPLYDELRVWLVEQLPESKRRRVQLISQPGSGPASGVPVSVDEDPGRRPDRKPLRFGFDGSVQQTFTYRGHQIRVMTEQAENRYSGQGRASEYESFMHRFATLKLSATTIRGRAAIEQLLDELDVSFRIKTRRPALNIGTRWGGFMRRADLPMRPLDTVVTSAGVSDALLDDMRQFLASESWYRTAGVPWHRGYLLWGKPGTGKTSLANALAHELNMDLYWMPIGDLEDDTAFLNALREIPPGSMLLLEDIDIVRASRQRDDDGGDGLDMQGLLNGLDGIVTPHGLITVMTTNRRDKLDPALTRSGRVAMDVEISPLRGAEVSRLVEMVTGMPVILDDDVEVLPSDLVSAAVGHAGDADRMFEAMCAVIDVRRVTA